MIRITVRYFAAFREVAGTAEEMIEGDFTTAAEVFAVCRDRHGLGELQGHCKLAINDELANWDDLVANGDVVLLFPPVAGG